MTNQDRQSKTNEPVKFRYESRKRGTYLSMLKHGYNERRQTSVFDKVRNDLVCSSWPWNFVRPAITGSSSVGSNWCHCTDIQLPIPKPEAGKGCLPNLVCFKNLRSVPLCEYPVGDPSFKSPLPLFAVARCVSAERGVVWCGAVRIINSNNLLKQYLQQHLQQFSSKQQQQQQ